MRSRQIKLIIQIPCFNEEKTLPLVFRDMPKRIPGVDQIEYQVIDDGSTDQTVAIAQSLGVHHIVRIPGRNRKWLGRAFRIGVDHALRAGADIVVNTDGDNQYPSRDIPRLIEPILAGRADVVIGDRDPGHFKEFSPLKRWLQRLGSKTVQFFTRSEVRDAVSGFRAYSREALLRIHVFTNFTYTVDTLMQAHKKGLEVEWIRIRPNAKTRESRLISSIWSKVRKSGGTILRISTIYEPFKTFRFFSMMFLVPGLALLGRFFYFYLFVPERSSGHVQSVVVGGVLVVIAAQLFVFGVVGELLATNRSLLEQVLTRLRRLELDELERTEETIERRQVNE